MQKMALESYYSALLRIRVSKIINCEEPLL